MKLGYARVSKDSQDNDMQVKALQKAGCKRVWTEKASGAKTDRAELAKLLDHAREGDAIVVWKLDRLARSVRQLIDIAADLQERKIQLISLTDNIDTTTPSGELHFHMLAALAQFERSLIRERVNAGLISAREKGRVGGRPT
jgi:DNA invertase Pin-like site-specific DNA recombinase